MKAGDTNLLPSFFGMTSCIITGGIGCGKTFLTARLHTLLESDAEIFSSDEMARSIMDEPGTQSLLADTFGVSILETEESASRVSRSKLRDLVFRDKVAREKLEAVIHPGVLAALEMRRRQAREAGAELFLAEVPLHYEIGESVKADLVIVVATSRTVQAGRLMERRGLDDAIIEQILRSQWPIEAKVEKADMVIWNDGDLAAFEAQVLTLARQFRQA